MNNLYLIVGQSGSGKSTIADKLESDYGIKQVLSYTTRKPRYDGENTHIFISDTEFDKLTDIAAFTEFDGHRYCATTKQLDDCGVYIIDPNGVDDLRVNYSDKPLKVIYVRVSAPIRYERMKSRLMHNGVDLGSAIEQSLDRIKNDVQEFYNYEHGLYHIDYNVKNDGELEEAVKKIYDYIQTEEGLT